MVHGSYITIFILFVNVILCSIKIKSSFLRIPNTTLTCLFIIIFYQFDDKFDELLGKNNVDVIVCHCCYYIYMLSGKPVVAAPGSLLLVSPGGKVLNSRSGRPVPVPRGTRITPVQHDVVLDDEGNPVLEPNGLPLQVTPGMLKVYVYI